MGAIANRVGRLEERMGGGPSRLIVLQGGRAGDDEVDALLAAKGIRPTPADEVVRFVTIYENRDGSEEIAGPLALVSVIPKAGRRA